MIFLVALELRIEDFRQVSKPPRAVICGLIPQIILLPVGVSAINPRWQNPAAN